MDTKKEKTGFSPQASEKNNGHDQPQLITAPEISLAKGGGAIKGIDEKFSVNAVNGSASFTIPLPFSQARGLTPSLSLAYNSGTGNGIFGLGWSLGLGTIKRKTERQLPRYLDAEDSDSFLFSGAEDLVPEFKKDINDQYRIHEKQSSDHLFTIRFYKPRTEGLFARIERWTSIKNGTIKWRVISKDNITTLYGNWISESEHLLTAVISDPEDHNRIFQWFPQFIFDDKGNCLQYLYKQENDAGFNSSLTHNRNRKKQGRLTYTNLYIEKILYGNKHPYLTLDSSFPDQSEYYFTTVFDYGEYNNNTPYQQIRQWDFRKDAFSSYTAGFEIRTTRLCKRILLLHHFDTDDEYNGLVKSINFEYDSSS